MTYIVAVKYGECSAIIADSRVSFEKEAEDTWLKTGLFFHGCMFGYCGCVESAREFIRRARLELTGSYISVREIWDSFVAYAEVYDYPTSESFAFELLLSTRAFGIPRFFVLDSQTRLLRTELSEIVTLGNGKGYLDDFVRLNFGFRPVFEDKLDQKPEVLPWMWCLQLMERAQGEERRELNGAGVGGYFHFSYQTAEMESRQPPAVYVLCEPDRANSAIIARVFRVLFCGPSLVVECPIHNQRYVIFDYASWPRVLDLDESQLEEIHRRVDAEGSAEPFYNFCGFGSSVAAYRGRNPAVVTNQTQYVIDRSGKQRPEFAEMAKMIFATDSEVEKSLNELRILPVSEA